MYESKRVLLIQTRSTNSNLGQNLTPFQSFFYLLHQGINFLDYTECEPAIVGQCNY